jgi:hypothetical protein
MSCSADYEKEHLQKEHVSIVQYYKGPDIGLQAKNYLAKHLSKNEPMFHYRL